MWHNIENCTITNIYTHVETDCGFQFLLANMEGFRRAGHIFAIYIKVRISTVTDRVRIA